MSTAATLMRRSDAPLARRNPVAKLAAGLALTFAVLATLDPVTPGLAIGLVLVLVPLFGVSYGELARRAAPVLLGATGVIVSLLFFAAERTGDVLFTLGPFVVTTGMVYTALGLSLRLFAVALPAILIFSTTDPTDLADALIQNLKAPPRFAIGALAALRLVPLLGAQWRLLGLARRARGVDSGGNPVAALRIFASSTFALLVGAIRRGTRLATAMDARGFDSGLPRTSARRQRFGPADLAFVAAAVVVSAALLATTIALGMFDPLLA
jgi:energy-coupling factor transport system permease protein